MSQWTFMRTLLRDPVEFDEDNKSLNAARSCPDPANEARLSQIESRIGYELPAEYRRFLLTVNGGMPLPSFDPFRSEGIPYIQQFYGTDGNTSIRGLSKTMETLNELMSEVRPKGFWEIGVDPGGNAFCIKLTEPQRGGVFYFEHQMVDGASDSETEKLNAMELVSDSFYGFCRLFEKGFAADGK